MEKCLFDRWYDCEKDLNLNEFTLLLFKSFIAADGTNRAIIKNNWPECFENLQSF